MTFKKKNLILCVLLSLFFYIYGLISYKYNLFPYHQLHILVNNIFVSVENETAAVYSPHYLSKKSFFDQNSAKVDVVMVGDSITMGAEWSELFLGMSIANRGISGDTTRGILDRMDSIYSTKAKKAFVMAGFNDIAKNYSSETIFRNYKKILALLDSHGIKPYIQSTLFVSGRRVEHNKKISTLNRQLKILASEKNYIFIDLNKVLSEEGRLKQSFTHDDLHLNGLGYSVWQQELYKYIR